MQTRVTLAIADLPVTVLDDAPEPSEWLTQRCKEFHRVTPDRADGSAIAIHRDPSFTLAVDETVVDLSHESGAFSVRGVDFHMQRRRCGLPIEVIAHPEAGLAGILRWAVGLRLIETGGLLVHGMAYVFDGSGVLAAGPSGRGKSTLSRLIRDRVHLLTDETAAVRFVGEAPVVYATPFAGELGLVSGPASAMLESLLFLSHATEHGFEKVGAADATAKLLGCVFAPLAGGAWLDTCLATAERVARSVPTYAFGFRPEPDVWEKLSDACHRAVPSS